MGPDHAQGNAQDVMTTGHVFVVASGFGKRVIPAAAPFTFRIEDDQTLTVGVAGREAVIESSRSVMDAASGAADVADVIVGPVWPTWWLETTAYRVPLPLGWTADASGHVDPSVFDLVGPDDGLIYVQVPRRAPPLHEMIARDQEFLEQGSYDAGDWIAVKYSHEGVVYVQRHAVVRGERAAAIVTLQSPVLAFTVAAPTHEYLANALQLI